MVSKYYKLIVSPHLQVCLVKLMLSELRFKYTPHEIFKAFNDLKEIAPHAIKHPIVAKSLIRRYLSHHEAVVHSKELVKENTTTMPALVLILIIVCSIVFINIPKQPQVTATSEITPVIVTKPFMHVWQDANLQPVGTGDFLRQEGKYIVIFDGIDERLLPINNLCKYDITYVDVILRLRGENGLE